MPVIRISEGTMRRFKTWAEPLHETAESASVKVLDAADSARPDPPPPARPNRKKP